MKEHQTRSSAPATLPGDNHVPNTPPVGTPPPGPSSNAGGANDPGALSDQAPVGPGCDITPAMEALRAFKRLEQAIFGTPESAGVDLDEGIEKAQTKIN